MTMSWIAAGPTAHEVMLANRHTGPGFDWLRILLSLLVILLHSFHVAYEVPPQLAKGLASPLWAFVLPSFFALSGFLVTGSAIRTRNLRVFLAYRALRIAPALLVEITLSAFVLGALVTSLPLREYFSHPQTLAYFGNVIGWVHFYLPGVFENNPKPGIVNQNLWTLHPELLSYAGMAGLIATGLVYNKRAMVVIWILATIALLIFYLYISPMGFRGTFPSKSLIYSFISGILLYHGKEYIRINKYLLMVSVIAFYILIKMPGAMIFALFPAYYITMFIGMQKFPRINWLQNGDYSYGLYLYGYPVQQTIVHLFPEFRHPFVIFTVATAITMVFAVFSWKYIEKPALQLKRFVRPRESQSLAARDSVPVG